MPPEIDLTGRVFGRLTVIAKNGRTTSYGGCAVYRCRCECGTELDVPQKRLPYAEYLRRPRGRVVDACAVCRGRPCPECGAMITLTGDGHGRRAACSPACADARRTRQGRELMRARRLAKLP